MSVENWIDTLCAVWDISDGKDGTLHSYRYYEKSDFPESIIITPCVLPILEGANMQIQASGGKSVFRGISEFHLTTNVDKSKFPYMALFFRRIRVAAAANMKLGGLVDHFKLRDDVGLNIEGPVILKYGKEDPHYGLVVYWEVKEGETDSVSA